MSVHQSNKNSLPDSEFIPGDITFLVPGNSCRLLDVRRTPGVIEAYFEDSAMFRWRITDFEDKGKYWDLPAEEIVRFQFTRDSKRLDNRTVGDITSAVNRYQSTISIEAAASERDHTEKEIEAAEQEAVKWLGAHSTFFRNKEGLNYKELLNLNSRHGPKSLAGDLASYMATSGLAEMESRTAEAFVLNPNSGEWIKGMAMVLAEMGLVPYQGKVPRTADIFAGPGAKENRRRYLANRLAFVRAYFYLLGLHEVVLYRGMSTERDLAVRPRTFLSCTFSLKVARSMADFERDGKCRNSYLFKGTFSVKQLFMTYLETEAMNRQYQEAEALVLAVSPICL